MAEEVQEGQQLSDSDKAAEKPAQDNPDQETEQKNVQLTSSGNNLFMNPTGVLFIILFIFDRLINTISKDRCYARSIANILNFLFPRKRCMKFIKYRQLFRNVRFVLRDSDCGFIHE